MAASPDDLNPPDEMRPEYDFRGMRGSCAASHVGQAPPDKRKKSSGHSGRSSISQDRQAKPDLRRCLVQQCDESRRTADDRTISH